MTAFDLSTPGGRFATYWRHFWKDHAYLRLTRSNAHWLSDELVRANQPWPFQVKAWADRGIKTIVNLRVGTDAHHVLEQEACDKYGVKQVRFVVTALEAPTRDQVLGAKQLFDELEYPAMMHCKSGADRAGMMSVLYMHFRQKKPIAEAIRQLDFFKYGHVRGRNTGVLDYVFEKYMRDAEPLGISYEDWVRSDAYDPVAFKREYRAQRWETKLANKLFGRKPA
ncbi:MAG TPA: protein tyrosine phosphatase [Caulobacteraceae bacterium]|nr:protein tyrosine phosphatase [Caulobacteraceae bacterium]